MAGNILVLCLVKIFSSVFPAISAGMVIIFGFLELVRLIGHFSSDTIESFYIFGGNPLSFTRQENAFRLTGNRNRWRKIITSIL